MLNFRTNISIILSLILEYNDYLSKHAKCSLLYTESDLLTVLYTEIVNLLIKYPSSDVERYFWCFVEYYLSIPAARRYVRIHTSYLST